MRNLQWFKDRIGKVVYRDYNKCDCKDCEYILENGKLIRDEQDAEYLYMIQNDFAEEIFLNYRDEKEIS